MPPPTTLHPCPFPPICSFDKPGSNDIHTFKNGKPLKGLLRKKKLREGVRWDKQKIGKVVGVASAGAGKRHGARQLGQLCGTATAVALPVLPAAFASGSCSSSPTSSLATDTADMDGCSRSAASGLSAGRSAGAALLLSGEGDGTVLGLGAAAVRVMEDGSAASVESSALAADCRGSSFASAWATYQGALQVSYEAKDSRCLLKF